MKVSNLGRTILRRFLSSGVSKNKWDNAILKRKKNAFCAPVRLVKSECLPIGR